ncbi:MAG: pyridoxamine 5'-phosphate oxidase family protein [Candidatus Schekmanbacteria bacterium]|nr:MAG: pyridoxamine 5'-phosphate oxidase family protein [Candidatus Schekmanbacteria bacterium]
MAEDFQKEIEKDFTEILKGRIKRLTKDELKDVIVEFLASHCLCTIATCDSNIPRSTPVRYKSDGLDIYILTEGGGKLKNILNNPKVSVSLYGEYSGFESVKGLQIWGNAEIITPKDKEKYQEARNIIKSEEREDLKKLGPLPIRDKLKVIKIKTEKARYLSFPDGILNQVWEAE